MEMTTLEELEKLYAAAQFIEKLCVSYAELGNEDTRRLYAFLMEGDAEDGVYVCVDEEPWGTADPPSPRLEAIAAAINALPELVARVRELEARVQELENAGSEMVDWAEHARIFVGSREKMHPDGQSFYDQARGNLYAVITRAALQTKGTPT